MKKLGTVGPRFQSYNVEMVEVLGGRFWKPYASKGKITLPPASTSFLEFPHAANANCHESTLRFEGPAYP